MKSFTLTLVRLDSNAMLVSTIVYSWSSFNICIYIHTIQSTTQCQQIIHSYSLADKVRKRLFFLGGSSTLLGSRLNIVVSTFIYIITHTPNTYLGEHDFFSGRSNGGSERRSRFVGNQAKMSKDITLQDTTARTGCFDGAEIFDVMLKNKRDNSRRKWLLQFAGIEFMMIHGS